MPKFIKKPLEIEAVQWTGENVDEIATFMKASDRTLSYMPDPKNPQLDIETLEGVMVASKNDWIIKGVAGEFYPCKPDIFKKTYRPTHGKPVVTPGPPQKKTY